MIKEMKRSMKAPHSIALFFAIRVVFDLRLKLHLPDVRNELRTRFISPLGKVLEQQVSDLILGG